MTVKVIVTDMDGTFLNDAQAVRPSRVSSPSLRSSGSKVLNSLSPAATSTIS